MMLAALIATDAKMPTQLTPEQLDKTIDFLIAVKKQSRVVTVSWGDLADAMARGDVAITFNGWETIQKFGADKGKKIAYTYPAGRHLRLARQLLHRQGRAQSRCGL